MPVYTKYGFPLTMVRRLVEPGPSTFRPWLVLTIVVVSGVSAAISACSWAKPETAITAPALQPHESTMSRVASADGTLIAVECAGSGPTLIIVHGGIGDRTRWTPLFGLLSSRLTVCAMDRRSHGLSGDSPDYSLQKEAEDVAAVVNSREGTVFVLGHDADRMWTVRADASAPRRRNDIALSEAGDRHATEIAPECDASRVEWPAT